MNEVRNSSSQNAAEVVVSFLNRITSIENQIEQINNGQGLQIAEQTYAVSRVSKKLVLTLGTVLGGMLGIISAFTTEFIGLVRKSLAEETI